MVSPPFHNFTHYISILSSHKILFLAKLVFLLNSFETVVTHMYFFTHSCRDVLFADERKYLLSFFESCGFAFADHPGQ